MFNYSTRFYFVIPTIFFNAIAWLSRNNQILLEFKIISLSNFLNNRNLVFRLFIFGNIGYHSSVTIWMASIVKTWSGQVGFCTLRACLLQTGSDSWCLHWIPRWHTGRLSCWNFRAKTGNIVQPPRRSFDKQQSSLEISCCSSIVQALSSSFETFWFLHKSQVIQKRSDFAHDWPIWCSRWHIWH